jgi:hypothetical protein
MKTTILSAVGFTFIMTQSILAQTANEAPNIIFEKTDVNCYGESSGSIISFVEGGQPPYSYSWSNGVEAQDIYNLSPGFYTLTVIDAAGTLNSRTTEIKDQEKLQIISEIIHPSTTTLQDGEIMIDIVGGNPFKLTTTPYLFEWSNNASTLDQDNLGIATYTISIFDRNGCVASESYTLTALNSGITNWEDIALFHQVTTGNVVYPNPSNLGGIVTVDYDYNEVEIITVLSVQGTVVKTYTANSNGKQYMDQLDKGIYFVLFSKGNTRTDNIRVVVQ